ncbi:MAG: ABC transporter ATP-binding protein [Janthinobacterium lividum]
MTKRYRGIPAVDDVSFQLEPGKVLGYLGPNGAGKSTTVKMITGMLEPTHGQILFRGRSIFEDLQAYRSRLGYVPEEAQVYTHLSGLEYLQLVGRLRTMPEKMIDRRSRALLGLFGLKAAIEAPISDYSKGMKQRVLLSAALLHDPELIVFDEPLSGLDAITARLFKDLLIVLRREGKAVLYISHVLEVVEQVCDRVVILAKGKVIADGSPRDLTLMTSQPTLERVFAQVVQETDTAKTAEELVSVMQDV